MNLDKHAEFWQDKDKWFLEPVGENGYLIVGHNARGQVISGGIEDDEIHEAVIQKMIEVGVKILTPDEVKDLYPSLPDDFDFDAALKLLNDNPYPPEEK